FASFTLGFDLAETLFHLFGLFVDARKPFLTLFLDQLSPVDRIILAPFGISLGQQLLRTAGKAASANRRTALGSVFADIFIRPDAFRPCLVLGIAKFGTAECFGDAITFGLVFARTDNNFPFRALRARIIAIDDQ